MNQVNATPLTDSKKAMWRSIIALASVDGEIEAQEKAALIDYVRSNKFPKEFESQLISDLETFQNFEERYAGVTDTQDRMQVINAALVIFHSDDDFEASERKVFELINQKQREMVDYKEAAEKAKEMVAKFKVEDARKQEAERRASPWIIRVMDSTFDLFERA